MEAQTEEPWCNESWYQLALPGSGWSNGMLTNSLQRFLNKNGGEKGRGCNSKALLHWGSPIWVCRLEQLFLVATDLKVQETPKLQDHLILTDRESRTV